MLSHTFCHIPGIGPHTERRLWAGGVLSWEAFHEAEETPLCETRTHHVRAHIETSRERLEARDAAYFHDVLPGSERWRLFDAFRDSVAYIDIETTGLGDPDDYITSIALYDGRSIRTFVYDDNLFDFANAIRDYKLLVTYNGKSFDVPFIRNTMGLPMHQAHIDLMYVLRALGYRGGLKGCERQLGISRGDLEGVDGFAAVLLWFDYLNHDNRKALETLLAYNVEDVVNLETLMVIAWNLKVKETPFADTLTLPMPSVPPSPFRADVETLRRLKREFRPF